MLLQIDKFSKKELEGKEAAKLLVDYIGGVSGTSCDSNAVKFLTRVTRLSLHLARSKQLQLTCSITKILKIVAVWLLNDEGKTLRKLI